LLRDHAASKEKKSTEHLEKYRTDDRIVACKLIC